MTTPDALPRAELDDVLVGLGSRLDDYRGRRILVTGGTGFFGLWLLESLRHANREAALDARIVVLSRDPSAFARRAPHLAGDATIEVASGDIRDFAPPSGTFDYVVHGAATTDARAYAHRPLDMISTIVDGTRRVLDFCTERHVRRMLFVSSGAVYGPQPPTLELLPEDFPGAPDPLDRTTVYAQAKRLAEHLCAVVAGTDHVVIPIARCFAFVGAHLPLDTHFAVGNFLRDALQGGPIRVAGNGAPYRSYLYATDLVRWLLAILASGQSGRAYNVGSDVPVSIAELAHRVAALVGADVRIAEPADPSIAAPRYVPDIGRARRELGLDVRVPLDDALAATLSYHRRHGDVHAP